MSSARSKAHMKLGARGAATISTGVPAAAGSTRAEGGDLKATLGRLLSNAFKSQRDGSYAGSGYLSDAPNPCLNIDDFGPLGLPLSISEAVRLMSVSELAPYGKGVETVVDTAVRQTWQIDASHVKFGNPRWSSHVQNQVLGLVSSELGVEAALTKARLYKLLLYSEGGHFERHQDTEKEPNMFGTLVIVLPSAFTGGEVVVTHRGQEKTFDLSPNSSYATSFTCLYTDVYHAVKPITSGYRLALVYNLVHTIDTPVPRAFTITPEMQELRGTLELWSQGARSSQADQPVFIAHLLEQNYSGYGLRFDILKGRDDVKVNYLRSLADELGFSLYLAHLKIDTHGYGEDTGCYRRGRYDSEESEDDGVAPSMAEETEPRDYALSKLAIGCEDSKFNLRNVDVANGLIPNIVPQFDLRQLEPDEWEDEGYMGNGAGSLDHHYHRTLVLLWPKEHDGIMAVRCAGEATAISELEKRVRALRNLDEPTAKDRQQVSSLAKALSRSVADNVGIAVARAAIALEDSELFLNACAGKSLRQIDATIWVGAILALGFVAVRAELDAMFHGPPEPVDVRARALEYIANAFPEDQEIQLWASEQKQRPSDGPDLDQREKLAPQENSSAEKENNLQTDAHTTKAVIGKRHVVEIIDLTVSPERPLKRRGVSQT